MRVVAGSLRGRRLVAPHGDATRPTADRVREAVFSMLGVDAVAGLRVLDLFAGSGAMGIEALSRGAALVVFVDNAPAAVAAIRANLTALGLLSSSYEVDRIDARVFVGRASSEARLYDLVFLDPPYARADDILRRLGEPLLSVLAPEARVVLECSRRQPVELGPPLRLLRERGYGDTLIRIYEP